MACGKATSWSSTCPWCRRPCSPCWPALGSAPRTVSSLAALLPGSSLSALITPRWGKRQVVLFQKRPVSLACSFTRLLIKNQGQTHAMSSFYCMKRGDNMAVTDNVPLRASFTKKWLSSLSELHMCIAKFIGNNSERHPSDVCVCFFKPAAHCGIIMICILIRLMWTTLDSMPECCHRQQAYAVNTPSKCRKSNWSCMIWALGFVSSEAKNHIIML